MLALVATHLVVTGNTLEHRRCGGAGQRSCPTVCPTAPACSERPHLCVSQVLHCCSTTLVPLPGLRCGQTAAGEAADSTGNQHFAALLLPLHCCLTSPQATESHPLPRSSSRTCRSTELVESRFSFFATGLQPLPVSHIIPTKPFVPFQLEEDDLPHNTASLCFWTHSI